uniref:Reverse transcriptase domain-containing protein n=1 Tax=Cyprinus carpio carpio TaxID=630221 RepID=A0A9J8CV62_CYPCA
MLNTFQGRGGIVKLISWNVKGLNNRVKSIKIFSNLFKLKGDICFLQETHLKNSSHKSLMRSWVGQVFHSGFNGKARGAAILINKNTPFNPSKVISDPNGRYVIVSGTLYGNQVALASVYAPNWDNPDFFVNLFSNFPDLNLYQLIMGGDFNCVLNTVLDRSSPRPSTLSQSSKTINSFLEWYGITDIWRHLNPTSKMFSFFSPVHHTYSRIDYFIIDSKLIPLVKYSSYGSIVISDHAPVILDLALPGGSIISHFWRMNVLLLSDSRFVEFISEKISTFLEVNSTEGISVSLLWDTLKAYLRGEIISRSAYIKKVRDRKLCELSRQIGQLDQKYALSPTPLLYKERAFLLSEYNLLSTNHAEHLLLKSRHRFYEFGDKPSKALALQLRLQTARSFIAQIQDTAGNSISDPQEINNQFKLFYSSLYQSDSLKDANLIDHFFENLDIPQISNESKTKLEDPIRLTEIQQAIAQMQSGKSPGPDGFPSEFLKKFSLQLSPLLLSVFEESLNDGHLPPSMRQASISLILKPKKNPLDCGSYRPISLLNVDVKILAKILSLRLESVIQDIIHPDQTGFIKNRQSFFNLRRLMNIIYTSSDSYMPEALVSLDAEKAFDRVEWDYLFSTLKKFGFGDKFVSWVKLLYSSPVASVKTNGISSEYFSLHRGTRQGCPLSPLLFAIAIEPLAISFRSNCNITGIHRAGKEQKISLYADDVVLYISNPESCLPHVLSILGQFGSVSGYKLNLHKSEFFAINTVARDLLASNIPFKSASDNFRYLGVTITRKHVDLFKHNFIPILERTKEDLVRWKTLPLSLVGRINTIKMNILPKFLFLFQKYSGIYTKSIL